MGLFDLEMNKVRKTILKSIKARIKKSYLDILKV